MEPRIAVFLLFLAVLLVCSYALTQTRFGTYVYAVGGNREAARRAGIPVIPVIIICFMICGVMATIGGVIAAARVLGVSSQSGSGSLLLKVALLRLAPVRSAAASRAFASLAS